MKPFTNTIYRSFSHPQWHWAGSLCLILLGCGTSVQAAEPIPIPVPPPEVTTLAPLPEAVVPDNTLERLPVPSTPIPIGYVGSHVSMNQLPPPPDTTAMEVTPTGRPLATGRRFRVIVLDLREEDTANQERLRSLVPEVLPIHTGQRRALQVGSFQDETRAKELRAYMEVNGFRAEIQRVP